VKCGDGARLQHNDRYTEGEVVPRPQTHIHREDPIEKMLATYVKKVNKPVIANYLLAGVDENH
jgi:hypothetical protein